MKGAPLRRRALSLDLHGFHVAARRGFTLIELLIAMVILGFIVGVSLTFLRVQVSALRSGTEDAETIQNLRYALLRLEGDLRTLGTNVAPGQPSLVYAGESLVAFFTDYATNVEDDPFAVYFTPGAPSGQVSAPSSPVSLPVVGTVVPDTTYESAPNVPGAAELMVYYFVQDSTSANAEDHALYRQVNNGAAELIARNLRRVAGQPFFRYMRIRDAAGQGMILDSVPANQLPLIHSHRLHGSAGDTASSARADSIRGVRVTLGSVGLTMEGRDSEVEASRVVRFPNAGLNELSTCGGEPILGVVPTAVASVVDGSPQVRITWPPAVDEAGGEQDVVRYVVWRRNPPGAWGDPLRSIPAGQAGYLTVDTDVISGQSLQYALGAQDCTPALSAPTVSGTVIVP